MILSGSCDLQCELDSKSQYLAKIQIFNITGVKSKCPGFIDLSSYGKNKVSSASKIY